MSGGWRRVIGLAIALLFVWQIASPVALAAASGGTSQMKCCLRAHGGKPCCPKGSHDAGGPAVREASSCSDECAAVAPVLSVAGTEPGHGSSGFFFAVSDKIAAASFQPTATLISSNSFQRPPPAV